MKKILFVFPQWHFNIHDTLEALTTSYEVHTLNFQSADEIQQVGTKEARKVHAHNLKLWRTMWVGGSEVYMPSIRDLWRKLDKRYDMIVFKNIYSPLTIIGMTMCRMKGIPFAFSEQKLTPQTGMKAIIPALIRVYLRGIVRTYTVPAVSPTAIGYQQLATYTKKRSYIPFVINTKNIPQKKLNAKRTVQILNISKFQERKDQLLLLHAVQQLVAAHPKLRIHITFIGGIEKKGEYRALLEREAHGGAVPVTFISKVERARIAEAYQAADLFVLSSYDEPAAYSHLEAMAHGLPVICSDANGTANYIQEGKNGFIFKARSLPSLQNAIMKTLLTNGTVDWKKLQRFGAQSRLLATTEHTPTRIRTQYAEVLG
jgi:glycosyltransferase involved in cell wall biosynthesis